MTEKTREKIEIIKNVYSFIQDCEKDINYYNQRINENTENENGNNEWYKENIDISVFKIKIYEFYLESIIK